jgi:hypothetical protein
MPVLVGLITYLALSGTPGALETFTAKGEDTSSKADGTFTQLSLNGTAGRVQTYTDKATASEDGRAVSDSYFCRVQFGDVSAVSVELTDKYIPVLSMVSVVGQVRAITDTYVPVTTLNVTGLAKSGSLFRAGSDTYVPVLSMTITQRDIQSVLDTYVPVLTFSVGLDASDEAVLTDTYVPVLTFDFSLDQTASAVSWAMTDSYVPVLTFRISAQSAGEVDAIHVFERPYGIIRIEEA